MLVLAALEQNREAVFTMSPASRDDGGAVAGCLVPPTIRLALEVQSTVLGAIHLTVAGLRVQGTTTSGHPCTGVPRS